MFTLILCVELGLESCNKFLVKMIDFFDSSVDSNLLALNSKFFAVNRILEIEVSLFSATFSIGGNATDFKFLN